MLEMKDFFFPGLVLILMALVTGALAVYRFVVSRHDDFHIHATMDEASQVGRQVTVAKRLGAVDRWGKLFTALTFAYFVVLAALFLYQQWLKVNQPVS